MTSLEIKATGSRNPYKAWELVIRTHDLGGTDYDHIGYFDLNTALRLADIKHGPDFLYGNPYTDKSNELKTCAFCGVELPTVCRNVSDIEDILERFPNANPQYPLTKHPKPNLGRGKCEEGMLKYQGIKQVIEQENKL